MVRRASRPLLIALGAASALGFGLAVAQPAAEAPAAPQPPAPSAVAPPAPVAPRPAPAPRPPPAPVLGDMPPEEEAAAAPPPPAASAAPPASDASSAPAKPAPPKRVLYTAAVLQVLDKVTAESLRFEAPVHKFIRYKGLIFLVNTCQSGDPGDPMAAHVEIDSQPPSLPGRPSNPIKLVYRGWMFADTPGPHPFSHPVYDVWLIACKMASPGA